MELNWQHIWEGWKNDLIPPKKLKEFIKQTSEERLSLCRQCPNNSKFHKTLRIDEHCIHCGCPLSKLTKCLSCDCSEEKNENKKWFAVLTLEQQLTLE